MINLNQTVLLFDIGCYCLRLLLFDVIGFIAWPSVAVGSCRLRPSAAKSGGKQFVTEAIARKIWHKIVRKNMTQICQKNMTKWLDNYDTKFIEKYDTNLAEKIWHEIARNIYIKFSEKYDTKLPNKCGRVMMTLVLMLMMMI